jgi:hypothetical protein
MKKPSTPLMAMKHPRSSLPLPPSPYKIRDSLPIFLAELLSPFSHSRVAPLSHSVTRRRSPSPELVRAAPHHPQQRHVPVVEPLLAVCPARRREARCLTVCIRGASPKFAPHRPNASPELRRSPSTRPRSTPATVPTPFAIVRSHKVEDNTIIYFLNHVLNLAIYRCNIMMMRFGDSCMILEISFYTCSQNRTPRPRFNMRMIL